MAYDMSAETSVELALLDKNDRGDKVRVARIDYKDKNKESTFDVRGMYTHEADGSIRATQKGIRMTAEMTAEVVCALFHGMAGTEQEIVLLSILGDGAEEFLASRE